jgi:hypothetical protein
MKLSTLALAVLAGASSTLATNPRALHISIDVQEHYEVISVEGHPKATKDFSISSGAVEKKKKIQHEGAKFAAINAHCDSVGTAQTDPDIDST